MSGKLLAVAVPAFALFASAGCLFLVGADSRNVSTTDAAVPDAPTSTASCRLEEPFSYPQREADFSTSYDENSISFTPDRLEAYVARRVAKQRYVGDWNFVKLFHYTRSSIASPWAQANEETVLDSLPDGGAASAESLFVRADGVTGFFESTTNDQGRNDLYWARRSALGAPWTEMGPVPGISRTSSNRAPWPTRNGRDLHFHSNRSTADARLYRASAIDAGPGGFPFVYEDPTVHLPNVNDDNDKTPKLTADELTLYTSTTTHVGSTDESRVYRSTRADRDAVWGNTVEVTELNVPGEFTYPTWLSADGCEIYLIAERLGSGGFDVYSARKPPR